MIKFGISKVLAVSVIGGAASWAGLVNAQDAMFVDSTGNVGIGTNTPADPLHILRTGGTAAASRLETTGGSATPRRMLFLRNNGDPLFRLENTSNAATWDFRITSGGFSITKVGTGQLEAEARNNGDFAIAGSYISASSRTVKDNIVEVDGTAVLSKLEQLPIAEWSYNRDLTQRHVGPMAEDFHAIFGLGPDNRHVTPTDLAGVALAAAKALKSENESLQSENEALKTANERILNRLDALERKLEALESGR